MHWWDGQDFGCVSILPSAKYRLGYLYFRLYILWFCDWVAISIEGSCATVASGSASCRPPFGLCLHTVLFLLCVVRLLWYTGQAGVQAKMALASATFLKPQTALQQLLEEINFQRTKEMRQLLKDGITAIPLHFIYLFLWLFVGILVFFFLRFNQKHNLWWQTACYWFFRKLCACEFACMDCIWDQPERLLLLIHNSFTINYLCHHALKRKWLCPVGTSNRIRINNIWTLSRLRQRTATDAHSHTTRRILLPKP